MQVPWSASENNVFGWRLHANGIDFSAYNNISGLYINIYIFFLEKNGKRNKANVSFHSPLGVIFGVQKYAASLMNVVRERNIQTHFRQNLIEIHADRKEAVFENLDTKEKITHNVSSSFMRHETM